MKKIQDIKSYVDEQKIVPESELTAYYADGAHKAEEEIERLVKEGYIIRHGKDKLASLAQAKYARGFLEIKRGGFAFVRDEGGDVFVPQSGLSGAFNREIVLVKIDKVAAKGKEGYVERILTPLPYKTVGIYVVDKKGDYVIDDNPVNGRYKVAPKRQMREADGKKVVFEVDRRATRTRGLPEGHVQEVLGAENAPGVDILSVARSFGLYDEFPHAVMQEVKRIPNEVSEVDLKDRELLFDKRIFTIDGEDAKDLDDAVSLEVLPNGNRLLGVHIADVSHYVTLGSALNAEALHRGTSVYLVDQVIPMLPRQLSNGICSLNEDAIRLTLSCFMEMDETAKVVNYRFAKTAIKSVHRLSYTQVNNLLEEDGEAFKKSYPDIVDDLLTMQKLAKDIGGSRVFAGSIDFDLPEAKILLDENKKPVKIVPRVQRSAEKLIEEFMVVANNTVAGDFYKKDIPFIYRVHDKPDEQKMLALEEFLQNFGYRNIGRSNKKLQDVLSESLGTPEENIIKTVTLRTMQKAVYDIKNVGHYGLGSEAYCHFTSPIRRYPDLIVHRLLTARIEKKNTAKEDLRSIAEQSSRMERNAIEAERKIDEIKKAEFMQPKIGEEFRAVVSGVASSAIFVQLPDTVEGVLPLSEMHDDYYTYNEELYCVEGRRTKKRISLGDEITVRLITAEPFTPRIEFAYVPLAGDGKRIRPLASKRNAGQNRDSRRSQKNKKPYKSGGQGARNKNNGGKKTANTTTGPDNNKKFKKKSNNKPRNAKKK